MRGRQFITAGLFVATAFGCVRGGENAAHDGEAEELDCGEGDLLEVVDEEMCVYRKELLVETGFSVRGNPVAATATEPFACPTLVPEMHSYGVFLVCSRLEELGEEFFDAMRERYGDEVEAADCTRVACLAGQTCVGGQCMTPGNDFSRSDCETLGSTDVANGADLTEDTCYLVDGDLEIFGGTLTIGPGVTLYFAADTGMTVREDGAIEAIGTIRRPVVFTGQEAERGFWRGIHLGVGNAETRLIRTVVEFGGGEPWNDASFTDARDQAAIVNGGGLLTLRESLVRYSAHYGLSSVGELGEVDGNLLTNNLRVASLTGANWARVGEANAYLDNTETLLGVDGDIGGDGTERFVWADQPAPYAIGEFSVAAAELQLSPGVEVLARDGGFIHVQSGGALTAEGTFDDPIRFLAAGEEPGSWRGIRVESDGTNRGPSSIAFSEIAWGGAAWPDGLNGNLTVIGSATIDDVTLRASASSGLAVDSDSVASVSCRSVTLEENQDADIVPTSLTCTP